MFINKNEFLNHVLKINYIIKRLDIILSEFDNTNNVYSYKSYETKIADWKGIIWSDPFPMHGQNIDDGVLYRSCIVSLQIGIRGIQISNLRIIIIKYQLI